MSLPDSTTSSKKLSRRDFLKLGLTTGAGALLAAVYPVMIERNIIVTSFYDIPVPNLPEAFEGFSIVQLTDLHYGKLVPDAIIQYVVHQANWLKKDIIVCTGDYVHENYTAVPVDHVWSILNRLKAPQGVYSVLGNHDHWASFERSLYWLETTGQNLRHKSVALERNGQKIWLGGGGDYWEDFAGIDKAFAGVPAEDCKILLIHNPDSVDTYFETRVDLVIAGHTHGGQVNIPFVGTPILPVSNKLYSSGYIKTEKTRLFISRGIGWTNLPVRFNCYPEIAVLKLTREST